MRTPHVALIRGLYHFRIRIPSCLCKRFGRVELKRSLATTDRAAAQRRGLRLSQAALALFDAVRRDAQLESGAIATMVRAFFALPLDAPDTTFIAAGRNAVGDGASAEPSDHIASPPLPHPAIAGDTWRDVLDTLDDSLAGGARPLTLLRDLLRVEIEAALRAIGCAPTEFRGQSDVLGERGLAGFAPEAGRPQPAPSCGVPPAGLGPKAWQDVAALAEAVITEKRLPAKMAEKYRSAARAFIDVIGSKPVWLCTEDDVLNFKDTLLDAPARFNTQHKFASIREAAADNRQRRDARAADARQPKPLPTLSTKTINANYLSPLRQIFAYAAANRATPSKINAAATVRALGVGGESKRHKVDKRLPFAHDDLRTLFNSPLFVGALSPKRLHGAGTHLEAGWRFWLPLGMYLMGLRPNEMGQAEVGDVVVELGWPCLRVTPDAADEDGEKDRSDVKKRVKTVAGERTLPIHPELLRLGFLDLVEAQRSRGASRILGDWRPGCDGTYSMTSSKVFNRVGGYLDRIGIKSQRHALYSLRHNYKNTLRRSGVFPDQQNLLMGHEDASVAAIYGSRELSAGLIQAVIDLDLDGITLDHIPARFSGPTRTFRVRARTVTIGGTVSITKALSSSG
ncbi:site-specific integrase [Azospirillum sp. YIM DDC1]|uniref:Site-specific integrase n=1 Tax=Azospirillum aestuarii TaxID=2802052 RepID=A0ABS1HT08_9PROT|nr:site-specific integrase [Azospirillum aestuarii]MBK4717473.1 site-specific integrase [Azospirillum aestuarii]